MDFLTGTDALLVIGDSDRNADLFYATGFRAPDPFVFLWTPQSRLLLIGDLELDRARQQADVDEVLSLSRYTRSAAEGDGKNGLPEGRYGALLVLLAERRLRTLLVPAEFPVEAADLLRQHGLTLQVAPAPLFPQRSKKRLDEVGAIAAAQTAAERAMACAIEAIRGAEVRPDGVLARNGEVLTSEALRRLVHVERSCAVRTACCTPPARVRSRPVATPCGPAPARGASRASPRRDGFPRVDGSSPAPRQPTGSVPRGSCRVRRRKSSPTGARAIAVPSLPALPC